MNNIEPAERRRYRILVAEDSLTQAARIEATLIDEWWDVQVVENGRRALEEARRTPPSLIVTDIVMPEMDGYALCRAIKEDPVLSAVPVILLTRLSDPADIARGLEVGADNFIRKPFRPQYLRDRVAYILHATELRREERMAVGLEIELGGRRYFINNDRQQILDLLISTYEQSIELNAELRERQEELELGNLRLAGLAKLAQRLNGTSDREEVAEAVLSCALDMPAISGGLMSLRDEGGRLRVLASRNIPPHLLEEATSEERQSLPHGSVEEVAGSGDIDCLNVGRLDSVAGQPPYRHLAIPLTIGGSPQGVLCLFGQSADPFADEERDTFNAIGNQATAALERSFLQQNLRKALNERTAHLSKEHEARDLAERALAHSEVKFEALVDTAPDGILLIGADGVIDYANRRAETMLGYLPGALRGASYGTLGEGIEAILSERGDHQPMGQTSGENGEAERLIEMTRGNGKTLSVSVTFSAIGGSDGRERILIVRDMSERLQMEQMIQQTQKLEAVGQLTGGVAHDFNNLLGVIIGNLDLLEPVAKQDPVVQKRVSSALRAALNGAELTKRLLAFARKQPLSPRPMCLAEELDGLRELLGQALKGDADLRMIIPPSEAKVMIDQSVFENVILNLAINARDAMPEGGVFTVEMKDAYLDERYVARNGGDFAPGQYLQVSVSDTGTGMSAEVLRHAFEPFYTTKEKGKGTGLGLSMTHGFVKQSGGHIKVYSEPGHGTSYHMYLPVINEMISGAQDEVVEGREPDGEGRILVVDDESDLAEVAVAYLTALGYEAEYVTSGEKAMETLRGDRSFDLILTDIVMPGGMGGVELHRLAAKNWPNLRFVYASGFSYGAVSAKNGGSLTARLVTKPFRKGDLAVAVRETLAAPPGIYKETNRA